MLKLFWPIARQNIARKESQTEYREKEGQNCGKHKPDTQETRCQQTSKNHDHVAIYRLIKMG